VYVVVEHNGGVYSCDFFVEPGWKLGNVMKGNLEEMLNSKPQHAFGLLKADLPGTCEQCKWLKHCWGGCTKDRIRDPQDEKLNHFCQSFKMFFEHADARLQLLAENWKNQKTVAEREALIKSIKLGKIKVGRNEPCPCGSGKKFKKCCSAYL
jgi:uncharacterized protein